MLLETPARVVDWNSAKIESDSAKAMAVRVGSSAKGYSVWSEGFGNVMVYECQGFGNVRVYEMWVFSCYGFMNVRVW